MRPPKISRDELLQRCASTFKRLGYHGTTMDTLAAACGLTKASFYHHYPNKESLLRDVLEQTHQVIAGSLFAVAFDEQLTPGQRLEKIGRKSMKLFQDGAIGCLMGVIAVDATYGKSELMQPIRAFLDDWAKALAQLFVARYEPEQALAMGRQLVADYEGAILLARIYGEPAYIEQVTRRALASLGEGL
ncbi:MULTISPECIES: TetR/AcrR family transcriptional regulator [Pseudomonas]|uniref:TetR family transcriptional regulator n=1 Tax=Pseudomonas piscis TaxID=2614538 RepID=A0A7X1PNY5_9PSED|nr:MULTISPECIES: TetR/AcrR family transcriptional regulator [Pseudomonas]MQA54640.1 TetR family transcriptional regulator [Pseudomonas piscis]POA53974.1 TetR family transcriptional regulator [Pseudomonas sp. FW507-12TSA]WMN20424.1 TetR/AcrR family transcriptional regulator [Pseudomonas piscis]